MTRSLEPLHVHRKGIQPCHHRSQYGLSCAQYDDLLRRSGNRCEICGRTPEDARQKKLYIDHDRRLGIGWDHVRGLVCAKCNSPLRYLDNGFRKPTPDQQRYLDMSWFLTGLPKEHQDEPWLPEVCVNSNEALALRSPRNR